MRAEITYKDDDRGSTTYRGIEATHYGGGDVAIIEDAGGTQVKETGVSFVHTYES